MGEDRLARTALVQNLRRSFLAAGQGRHRWQVGAEHLAEVSQRHAPGLADGGGPAGHGHWSQVGEALVAAGVAHQDLPAPEGAVGAPAHPVEHHADGWTAEARVGETGRQVGVVVLDPEPRPEIGAGRELGRQVLGVEIVNQQFRVGSGQVEQVGHRGLEGGQRGRMLQVSEVHRHVGVGSEREAHSALEFRSHGQHGRAVAVETHPAGRETPGSAQQLEVTGHDVADRVIGPPLDHPIMAQYPRRRCPRGRRSLGRRR